LARYRAKTAFLWYNIYIGGGDMLKMQTELNLSEYSKLYDILIPRDNELRQINELVDFEFVYEELKDKYSPTMGRSAIDPIVMFKYLQLKALYPVSDQGLVERAFTDVSYKFFLGLNPEDPVIDSSSLTKFRRQRLSDTFILDLLIKKTVQIAKDKGLLTSKTIIVDSTHTVARYNQKSPLQVLQDLSKDLRKNVYQIDNSYIHKTPQKPSNKSCGMLDAEIEYVKKLTDVIRKDERLMFYRHIKEGVNYLVELIDDHMHEIALSKDEDAKVGHKNADTHFFGYKTHLAMSEERIITAATVTLGEKHDGKQLESLVKKSRDAGMKVESVIGDGAYSEKENIELADEGKNFKLYSRLSRNVSEGIKRKVDGFFYNKDARMMVCPEGHMSIRKTTVGKKKHLAEGKTMVETYHFDIEKCKICPLREGCYKEGSKSKSYSVSIKSDTHNKQMEFQETDDFKLRVKQRYKIEAKNAELKNAHAYGQADSHGISGMNLQAATTIFVVNIKRIMKLMK
jgi:transposase